MRLTIFGSGYVGLVTGACMAEMGNHVVCVDIDEDKIKRLNKGDIPIYEPGLEPLVERNVEAGRLECTTDIEKGVDHGTFQFIAVGTPPDEDGSADLKHVLAVAESFGLLWLAATRWELDAAHQQTMMFLQLVAGGHLLLFLTRARGAFFRRPWPSPALLLAVVGTQLLAVAMCGFGWLVPALPWPLIGVVWLYNVAWMGVLDALKVAVYRVLETRRRGGTTFLRRVGRSLDLHGPVRRPRRTAAGGPARPG